LRLKRRLRLPGKNRVGSLTLTLTTTLTLRQNERAIRRVASGSVRLARAPTPDATSQGAGRASAQARVHRSPGPTAGGMDKRKELQDLGRAKVGGRDSLQLADLGELVTAGSFACGP
jgi:hypothetical protein